MLAGWFQCCFYTLSYIQTSLCAKTSLCARAHTAVMGSLIYGLPVCSSGSFTSHLHFDTWCTPLSRRSQTHRSGTKTTEQ